MSTPSLEALKSVALATAIAAGDLLAKGAQMKVNASTDDDVKMQADVDSEHLVRDMLKATGIPVIGEELGFAGRGEGIAAYAVALLEKKR